MKQLTESQFLALELNKYAKSVSVTNSEFTLHEDSINELGDNNRFESWQAGYCLLANDGIELEFAWIANGGQKTYESAFEFEIDVDPNEPAFELTGFVLVDDEGEQLERWERDNILNEFLKGCEWESHVGNEMPKAEIEELEMSESNTMTEYSIERDNERALKFKGEILASAASSANQAMGSSYSGSTGRWKELTLYKTQAGKFICEQVECTQWQGERNRHKGAVCDSVEQVIEFFGSGWLAKELYESAGIDASVRVE